MADTSPSSLRLAIAATFTADPIASVISFWKNETESELDVRFAPYNQVLQSLLDPSSELSLNSRGANVILLRLEDLAPDAERMNALFMRGKSAIVREVTNNEPIVLDLSRQDGYPAALAGLAGR